MADNTIHDLLDEVNCADSCEAVTALCALIDELLKDIQHLELECIGTRYLLSQHMEEEQGSLLRSDILENLGRRHYGSPAYQMFKELQYNGGDPMEFRDYLVKVQKRLTTTHDGRELRHIRTESKEQDGYTRTIEVYGCADCSECEYKSKCLYKYNAEKNPERNKVMKINERWEELREESNRNIQSEEGILKRQTRSIQTEGHFGDIKENENFRRFNYRSEEKVYKEFMLYAIGRNIMKYHRFLHREIEKFEGKKEQKAV